MASTVHFAGCLLSQLVRRCRRPWARLAWVARLFLYAALGWVVLANWHVHVATDLFRIDLDVEATAPGAVPAGATLPVRVAVSPVSAGVVRSVVHWCALDERGLELARGEVECYSHTTLELPHAARVRAVTLAVHGPKGVRSLRLERTGAATGDRAATTSVQGANGLWRQANRELGISLWVACCGLVACGTWFAAEFGAWLARITLRRASTWRWQCLAAMVIAFPVAVSWWHLASLELKPYFHMRETCWLTDAIARPLAWARAMPVWFGWVDP